MKIKCPACSKVLSIPDSAAGKVVKCPCGKQLRAPAASGAPAAARPAAAPAAPRQPVAKRPAAPAPVAPTSFDGGGFFDELTESDLQPVKAVNMPGRAEVRDHSASAKALKQYTSPSSGLDGLGERVGNMTLAGPGLRIIATLIDGLMYGFFAIAGVATAVAIYGTAVLESNEGAPNPNSPAFVIILTAFYFTGQLINIILISMSGQTVGKKVMGIRIVNSSTGVTASFGDGWFTRNVVFGFLCNIPLVGFFIAIADIVYLFMDGHETVHDKLAKTMVVQNNA